MVSYVINWTYTHVSVSPPPKNQTIESLPGLLCDWTRTPPESLTCYRSRSSVAVVPRFSLSLFPLPCMWSLCFAVVLSNSLPLSPSLYLFLVPLHFATVIRDSSFALSLFQFSLARSPSIPPSLLLSLSLPLSLLLLLPHDHPKAIRSKAWRGWIQVDLRLSDIALVVCKRFMTQELPQMPQWRKMPVHCSSHAVARAEWPPKRPAGLTSPTRVHYPTEQLDWGILLQLKALEICGMARVLTRSTAIAHCAGEGGPYATWRAER